MASFKSLLLGLMLALMAAYNASCYVIEGESVIWTAGETLDQGARRLENLVLEATNRGGAAVPSGTPRLFFTELHSTGLLNTRLRMLQGKDWNSWINSYLTEQRRRLVPEQYNRARSGRPSG
ncbi:hypothetical protein NDA13_003777 [Ustilago tritici]|nr:hypothetical protein NDA13_003777 [Ustilago tritici]